MRHLVFLPLLSLACAEPPPPDEPPAPSVDVDVRMMNDFVVVYARERGVTCDCQDGTFPDEGTCTISSDVPICDCDLDFPIAPAPCLDSVLLTQTNVTPPRTLELQGGALAVIALSVVGIDIGTADFTLTLSGCGGDMEIELPRLAAAPEIVRARRDDAGVVLELSEPQGSVVFSGGQCGFAESNELLIEDAWQDEFASGAASLRTRVLVVESAIAAVAVWHEHRQVGRVVVAEATADGSLKLPFERNATLQLTTEDADVYTNMPVDVRAAADGRLSVVAGVVEDVPPDLAISAARIRFGEDSDTVELDVDATTYVAQVPHVDVAALRAEGLQLTVRGPVVFEDEAGVAAPIDATTFEFRLFSRDAFVTSIE